MSKESNPVRSMTGYARTRRTLAEGELVLSIRTVNHRGLDLHLYLGLEMEPYESAVRAALLRHIHRGHVDLRARLIRSATAATLWNRALMRSYLEAFRQAASEFDVSGEPDLNSAFRVPGMFSEDQEGELGTGFEPHLVEAVEGTARELSASRAKEGGQIAAELAGYNARIHEGVEEIEQIRVRIAPELHARLSARLAELLQGVALDPARIVQETAILADRTAIAEETTRLKIHCNQLDDLLGEGGEAGKKLEFLVQEMHRETGTILSKSNAAGEPGLRITQLALAIKSQVEKIREQALNLE